LRIAAAFVLCFVSCVQIAAAAPEVVRVSIDGVVHPVTAEIVRDAVQQASAQQATLLLICLNTPGGLLDATRQIVQQLVNSPIPVVTYVTPSGGRAASAGFFILEAGDVAAMAPETNTGASSPVLLGQTMDAVMRKKVENDAAALLRSLTSRRGRNVELAEQTVRDAKSFTDTEALDHHLIELVADNETQLLAKLDGREITRLNGSKQTLHVANAQVVDVRLSARERLIDAIADPNIGFVLLAIGALGIYIEFSSPGLIFPGVAGAVLVLLGLSSLAVLPINWAGAALLILAIVLFALEAKFTSHGILGIGGTIAMILGAVILVNGPPALRIHWTTAFSVALPFALITTFLMSLVVKSRRRKPVTGEQALVGEIGIARTRLAPDGQIFIHGEYWQSLSSINAEPGDRVRVTRVDGLTLHVEPASGGDTPASGGELSKGTPNS
jgi:membrane-bound serine protease (ClpP class)